LTSPKRLLSDALLPIGGAVLATVVAVGVTIAFLAWRTGEQHRVLEARTARCKQGDATSCEDLGSACLKRSGNACAALADIAFAEGPHHDPTEAMRLLGEACVYHHAFSCLRKGRKLLEGDGVPKDAAEARALLDRGCNLGAHEACALRQTIP